MRYIGLICILIMLCASYLHSAWLDNIPNKLTQPDGTVIDVFYSGDEHHNWAHDKDYYTMIIDEQTGFVCWAVAQKGDIVSTGKPVHLYTPQSLRLTPKENISLERYRQKRQLLDDSLRNPPTRMPTTGTVTELVIFVRFSDDNEFTQQTSYYDAMFNDEGEGVNSLKQYYWDASYNQLIVDSPFFPVPPGNTIISYQDTYPRSYFQPYNASTNPNGYQDNQRTQREHQLLQRTVNFIASEIPTTLNIDSDNDGEVDNVNFVVRGTEGAWNVLLWPHKWSLFSFDVRIHGKRVYGYNFNIENHMNNSGVSVLAHEFGHSLGAPDYYRYEYNGTPVGQWDIMASNTNPPQSMSAYTKWYYMHWVPSIPTVTYNDYYTLYPNSTHPDQHALKIPSPNSSTEYFVVEYRSKLTGLIDSALPGSGLVVWRIDGSIAGSGNSNGPPDELYVYRPNGTTSNDGTISQAYFSTQAGRTAINDSTNPSSFLQNGQPGGLDIYSIGSAGDSITFYVNVGQPLKPPANLSAQLSENSVILSWDAPENATPTGYSVYRDQTPLNQNLLQETTYTDPTLATGIYAYIVRAVYSEGTSSDSNTAQVVVMSPSTGFTSTFEDGTPDGWAIVNGSQTNKWIVGTSTASAGDYSIYISSNNSSNTYNIDAASIVHFFRDIIYTFPINNTLTFDFKGMAETNYDYLRVYLCETNYIPVAGSYPTGSLLGEYGNNVSWTPKTINLPDQPLNTTKRVVFTWRNDTNTGTQPPPAVDNIVFISGTPPIMNIEPASHDFAQINVGATSPTQTFTITNTGDRPLVIGEITLPSTSYRNFTLVAEDIPWTLAADAEQTFTVSFSPSSVGIRTSDISISHNADGSPTIVALSGEGVEPVFSINPSTKDFGNVLVGATSETQTFTITNTGSASLTVNTITLTGTDDSEYTLTVTDIPCTLDAEGTKEFTVSFSPVSVGAKTANISITHTASGSPATVALSGAGIAPSFSISPATKDFGDIAVGVTSEPQTFTITNNGTAVLTIGNITLSGANESEFTLIVPEVLNIAPEGTLEFTVSFSPVSTGAKTASLSITHNAGGSPATVALTGNGTAPVFSISPTSHIFEETTTGTISEAQTFTITNSGTAILTINTIALSGTDESEFTLTAPDLPWAINAGGNHSFTVSFTPVTTGAKTASVNITHNAEGSPHSVTLTGTGTPVSDFDEVSLPAVTALAGNYPNPFNPETTIRFSLARESRVEISIYSINGQLVRSLVNGSYGAGVHSAMWNGRDSIGRPVSSGVYFYRMTTSGYSSVRKMVLLK